MLKPHPFHWIVEPLFELPSYVERSMFGCRACYVHGKLKLVLAATRKEPWNGVLVPAEWEHHPSLTAEFSSLESHPILGKWLYLSHSADDFEEVSGKIVRYIEHRDERIGTEPKPRRRMAAVQRSKKKAAAKKRKRAATRRKGRS